MAVPKRKTSKSKRDKRRTHDKISGPELTTCPECNEARLPHHACPECGAYKSLNVLEKEVD
ncbi:MULTISPECIES: 50S ribosomal protein L32 [Desulfococcus]|jgi:large subunit ribosomal protein L32|uniref:Large ribosomal subunit protein bL32 n=1 Tax=Desulfococcus multivorans DSM 2059 TaxID=1121405 RepID=S7TW13_DESML|nr:50S ribosomal protein L32 [Desulfococcus multivorans]AOY59576.1 RpmF: 50S ribosomal protein L32 [Desulfococcus multivorans]AQV01767.1 50S ribosomal protein L32 [Desulfococcus multivorans]EPR41211.1 50S ribosomal protein L32 [Desulfococcus multivorans DSM 2059]MDX9819313.1 50S ribosomal protein L32 [Desulfococcus multivorans]SKA25443.1 LSU ribosomal protein L32P [Desulfococcus multivorans DSM 2059]